MRRAIVTGAYGFLGRHLVRNLREHGVHVTALSRHPGAEPSCIAMGDAPWDSTRLARIIETAEPDAIFHLVGGAVGSEAKLQQLNVGVAMAIMQALRDAQVRPLFACCGSAAEYGANIVDRLPVPETITCAPISAYGATKLTQSNAALAFSESTGTRVLIARIFNPIGPAMPTHLAIGDFARQIAVMPHDQGVLQTGNIHVFRDFLDVEHVVMALSTLAQNPDAHGVVNVCSGQATELSKLVEILIEISGKNITIETTPARMRADERSVIVGSTARLAELGAAPPHTNYPELMARVWQDAETRWAARS